jgi:hypothetical protein
LLQRLKFVAAEERDLFYDGFLCALCHLDSFFQQHQLVQFISSEDIASSRFLKANLVQNANGDYIMLSFNRRSLLQHQTSIAVLKSAGLFSNTESVSEFLASSGGAYGDSIMTPTATPTAAAIKRTVVTSSSTLNSLNSASIETGLDQLATVVSRTPSSTSIISAITTTTEDPIKESKKNLIPNFGLWGSQHPQSNTDQDLSDLGSIYGNAADENRPIKRSYFTNKSPNEQPVARFTFSHNNPISETGARVGAMASEGEATHRLKSQSFGADATAVSPRKATQARSSFVRKDPPGSSTQSSVGAENASRFMKQRSSLEGRQSVTKADSDVETLTQPSLSPPQPPPEDENDDISLDSRPSRSSGFDRTEKLRRRGSASAALAQQTANFRKRMSDQATPPTPIAE